MIPYGRQNISETDIESVIKVLRSDFLTQGPCVPQFESAVGGYCGAEHGVAVVNATSALHLACLALGLGEGDTLWTSAVTFVASANCALYCGAKVDFVDIDPNTYNLSVAALKEKLVEADRTGCLPKIVVPVHLCGQSCDMQAIYELSLKYGFRIVEDASHAIGGKYQREFIGNCRYSDITVFSFHPVKIITTGEGGMALTNSSELANLMRLLRSHGIHNESTDFESRPDDEIWNYQQVALGYNFRMTDIQAALGVSQLARINDFIARRREIAECYDRELAHLPLKLPAQNPDCESSYHLYPIRIDSPSSGKGQREVYEKLHLLGINVNLHYIPVYRQPYFEHMGFMGGYCEEAESYHKSAISLPIYPSLSLADRNFVIESIRSVLR